MMTETKRPDGAPDCYASFDILQPTRCDGCKFIKGCKELTRFIRFGKVKKSASWYRCPKCRHEFNKPIPKCCPGCGEEFNVYEKEWY